MSTWKWDWQHSLILAGFALGIAWYVLGHLVGQPITVASVLPVGMVALSAVFAFFKSPPSNPADAFKQGAANTNGSQRGFSSVRSMAATAIVGLAMLAGCAWFKANSKVVTNDAAQVASCVLGQVFQGASDPVAITAACAPATLEDVVSLVENLLQFYTHPQGDGGVPAAPAGLVERLHTVSVSGRAAMAAR